MLALVLILFSLNAAALDEARRSYLLVLVGFAAFLLVVLAMKFGASN